jgi:SPP1 family predicted phage head-tail adaptor
MSVGALRKRLTLQSESLAPDGAGGSMAVWTTLATVWGELEPVTGSGTVVVSGFDKRITHTIKLRYRSDITIATGMRLLFGSRIFTIRSAVNLDETNRWIEVQAEENGLLGA